MQETGECEYSRERRREGWTDLSGTGQLGWGVSNTQAGTTLRQAEELGQGLQQTEPGNLAQAKETEEMVKGSDRQDIHY